MTDPTRRRLLERGPDGKPVFRYVGHAETDIAATFERIRREQQQQQANVAPLRRVKK